MTNTVSLPNRQAVRANVNTTRVIHLKTISELRGEADQWDDLWRRSAVTTPTARAELVAQWVEQFAPRSGFRAIVVEHDGRWAAAIPLVKGRLKRVLTVNRMCGSTWILGGALLLDETIAVDTVMDALVKAFEQLPCQLLWLSEVAIESSHWMAFRQAIMRSGMRCVAEEEYQVGLITMDRDWESFRSQWSRNHRRNMSRYGRALTRADVRFEMLSRLGPAEVEDHLRRAFEIEHRSWKGDADSSVIGRGQFPFVLRQAKQLAHWGQLELAFLRSQDGPIAFSYGFRAKDVSHVCKIGYDPQTPFAHLSPGKMVLCHLLEHLFRGGDCRALDFFGRLTDSTANWKPTPYPFGRIVVAPGRLLGRLALRIHARRRRQA